MQKIVLLYNRKSGRQRSQQLLAGAIDVFEASGVEVVARNLNFEGNTFEGLEGVECVVVAGGDGTIGYVVDSMLRYGIDLPLGIIPLGTANDFAGMLGLSRNPRLAAQQILDGRVRAIDCGRVNGQYFVNVFSFGLFTTTSQHTPDLSKRLFGPLAYIAEGVRELRDFRMIPLTVRGDDFEFSAEVVMTLVFNGRTAGRIPLSHDAQADDGLLDAVFVTKQPLPKMLFDGLRYLCGGSPSSIKCVRSRHLHMASTLADVATDTDGQHGPLFPLDIECMPSVLKIRF